MKRYGPYTRKDGRQIVVLYDGEKTTSISYPRLLVDAPKGTEVHHKDENVSNNDLSNLEILSINEHKKQHPIDKLYVEVECENCHTIFLKPPRKVRENSKLNQSNTCSRSCAATLGGKASGESRRKRII